MKGEWVSKYAVHFTVAHCCIMITLVHIEVLLHQVYAAANNYWLSGIFSFLYSPQNLMNQMLSTSIYNKNSGRVHFEGYQMLLFAGR